MQEQNEVGKPASADARDVKRLEVRSRLSENYWNSATKYQFWYSTVGLVIGTICVLSGVVLFFHGVGGTTSWTADCGTQKLHPAPFNIVRY
jgi:hypothetical protein